MEVKDIISIVALIVVPIVAVIIGQCLQNRAEKRKDKMNVFKAVMTFRYGWSKESVEALNCIPIVFSETKTDEEVRKCWKEYYKCLCIQEPDEMELKQRNDALFKLLLSMAKELGYKDKVTWEDIQNPYIPRGMSEVENNNAIIQQGMASVVQMLVSNSVTGNNKPQKGNDTK